MVNQIRISTEDDCDRLAASLKRSLALPPKLGNIIVIWGTEAVMLDKYSNGGR